MIHLQVILEQTTNGRGSSPKTHPDSFQNVTSRIDTMTTTGAYCQIIDHCLGIHATCHSTVPFRLGSQWYRQERHPNETHSDVNDIKSGNSQGYFGLLCLRYIPCELYGTENPVLRGENGRVRRRSPRFSVHGWSSRRLGEKVYGTGCEGHKPNKQLRRISSKRSRPMKLKGVVN